MVALSHVANQHLNVTLMMGELNFKFYLILVILNLNSYMWLVSTTLDTQVYTLQCLLCFKLVSIFLIQGKIAPGPTTLIGVW